MRHVAAAVLLTLLIAQLFAAPAGPQSRSTEVARRVPTEWPDIAKKGLSATYLVPESAQGFGATAVFATAKHVTPGGFNFSDEPGYWGIQWYWLSCVYPVLAELRFDSDRKSALSAQEAYSAASQSLKPSTTAPRLVGLAEGDGWLFDRSALGQIAEKNCGRSAAANYTVSVGGQVATKQSPGYRDILLLRSVRRTGSDVSAWFSRAETVAEEYKGSDGRVLELDKFTKRVNLARYKATAQCGQGRLGTGAWTGYKADGSVEEPAASDALSFREVVPGTLGEQLFQMLCFAGGQCREPGSCPPE